MEKCHRCGKEAPMVSGKHCANCHREDHADYTKGHDKVHSFESQDKWAKEGHKKDEDFGPDMGSEARERREY